MQAEFWPAAKLVGEPRYEPASGRIGDNAHFAGASPPQNVIDA
jgi:hypothetical protein